jgi:hypothetical protein
MGYTYTILVRNSEGKRPLRRSTCEHHTIKTVLKRNGGEDVNWFHLWSRTKLLRTI